eukprot:1147386-Amphidinium_carterae.2
MILRCGSLNETFILSVLLLRENAGCSPRPMALGVWPRQHLILPRDLAGSEDSLPGRSGNEN